VGQDTTLTRERVDRLRSATRQPPRPTGIIATTRERADLLRSATRQPPHPTTRINICYWYVKPLSHTRGQLRWLRAPSSSSSPGPVSPWRPPVELPPAGRRESRADPRPPRCPGPAPGRPGGSTPPRRPDRSALPCIFRHVRRQAAGSTPTASTCSGGRSGCAVGGVAWGRPGRSPARPAGRAARGRPEPPRARSHVSHRRGRHGPGRGLPRAVAEGVRTSGADVLEGRRPRW
jgi:hypothetical protein